MIRTLIDETVIDVPLFRRASIKRGRQHSARTIIIVDFDEIFHIYLVYELRKYVLKIND